MTTRPRRQDRTLPLVFVALVLLVLIANLANVGWLRPDALFGLVQFWPLVLVAAGVDLLLRGRYRILVVFGAVLVAPALYAGVGVLPGAVARTETVAQGLEGARQAEVVLQVGVSDLYLNTTGGDGTALLEGTVQMARGKRLTRLFREASGTAAFELRSTSRGPVGRTSGRRSWNLSLNAAVPTALTVATGVGRCGSSSRAASGLRPCGVSTSRGTATCRTAMCRKTSRRRRTGSTCGCGAASGRSR